MTTYYPLSLSPLQYVDANGTPYSGAVIKLYEAGTTTPINISLDRAGGTLINDVTLNAAGYPEVSSANVILHAAETFKISIYPTQDAADSDSGALLTIDNINPITEIKSETGEPPKKEPFGAAGQKVLVGEDLQQYYGFAGITVAENSNLILIYRKGTTHAIEDNTSVRCRIYSDAGNTIVSDSLVFQNALSDARPDAPKTMASGRIGFFINRQDEGSTHFSPLFMYSDDNGSNWTTTTVTLSSPYTFQATGGIIDYPASQGGHDQDGFITFGYADAGGVDGLATTDNGITWTIESNAGVGDGVNIIVGGGISENVNVRIGTQDKWLMFCRSKNLSSGWNDNLMVYATADLKNWGTPTDAGIQKK